MSNDDKSLAHTRWNCKYHLVFTPKYRRKVIYGQLRRDIGKILRKLCEMKEVVIIHERHANLKYNYGNRSFWSKGYYVSTVGLNQKTIAKYIREQEAEDRVRDSINKREYKDPFSK